MGALPEPSRLLGQVAEAGIPSVASLSTEFRKLRGVMAAEPARPDAPWSERLLKMTDGLIRIRPTGAVEGSSPAALAARIDQALKRADSAGALESWSLLPEPARRASDAFGAMLRRRAEAEGALKAISDDAVKTLSAGT
jgi:hypothetical protein